MQQGAKLCLAQRVIALLKTIGLKRGEAHPFLVTVEVWGGEAQSSGRRGDDTMDKET